MYLSELIVDFLEYLEVERGRSQKTAENYHLYLNRLVEFNGDMTVDKINNEWCENGGYGLIVIGMTTISPCPRLPRVTT